MNITRRQFCSGVGSALTLSAAGMISQNALGSPAETPSVDMDPRGGFTLAPPRLFLFTDWRHIDPAAVAWRTSDGTAIPVAGPPELPVPVTADPSMIPHGIRLAAMPARYDPPDDSGQSIPSRVIYDNGLYRSWSIRAEYAGKDLGSYSLSEAKSITVAYGESHDGYAWTWNDTTPIPISGVTGIDGEYVFIDDHGPENERYKAIFHAAVLADKNILERLWRNYEKIHPRYRDSRLRPDRINALYALVSPDGLNWKPVPQPLLVIKGDTDNTVYYDGWLGKYVLYTRLDWLDRRSIARSESDDFYHWTPVSQVVQSRLEDPPYVDIYTNARTCYPGLPSQHLMFPFFYNRYTESSEVHLYSSLDGVYWDHVPGSPVLTPGDPGQWNGGFVVAGKNLVPLGPDKIALPFYGISHPHKFPRWKGVIKGNSVWATWPRGRLTAVIAADEEGGFQTFSVPVIGKKLIINAKVRRAGEIRVGLVDIKGRSLDDCDPFTGDSLAHTVTWKGDSSLGLGDDNTVCLRFRLRLAELYSFEWA